MRSCRPCHGALGDGHGPQAVGMDPPPRDLRLGIVTFASVPAGSLWRDEDVIRIVRSGLAGTGMRAWKDIPDDELARHRPVPEDARPALPRRAARRADRRLAGPLGGPRGRRRGARPGRLPRAGPLPELPPGLRHGRPRWPAFARDAGVLLEPGPRPASRLESATDFGRAAAGHRLPRPAPSRRPPRPPRRGPLPRPSPPGWAAPPCRPGRGRSPRPTSGRWSTTWTLLSRGEAAAN